MGGRKQKSKKKQAAASAAAKKTTSSAKAVDGGGGGSSRIDPDRVRFQHSRIRPHFSGCGRSVEGTLEDIRRGKLSPEDLPPIQVIIGPDENDGKGPWYFSLNNRRLWVLKRCKEEGLLEKFGDGLIAVRVRPPKSEAEADRYSLQNCAVEAKFIREKGKKQPSSACRTNEEPDSAVARVDEGPSSVVPEIDVSDLVSDEFSRLSTHGDNTTSSRRSGDEKGNEVASESESDSSSDDDEIAHVNPFSALI